VLQEPRSLFEGLLCGTGRGRERREGKGSEIKGIRGRGMEDFATRKERKVVACGSHSNS